MTDKGEIKVDFTGTESANLSVEITHGDIYRFGIESVVAVLRDLVKTNPKFTIRIKSETNNAETVLLKFIDKDKDDEDAYEW